MSASQITTESGVYQIRNITSNKIYVGSSVNLRRRWRDHRYHLSKGSHHSRHLLSAWRKHGEAAFRFEVLEIVANRENLVCAEQRWMNQTQAFNRTIGYNASPVAASPSVLGCRLTPEHRAKIGAAHRGRKKSPEHRAKISEANKGRKRETATFLGRKHTLESRAKMSAANRRRVPTQETRAKLSASSKSYVYTPEQKSRRAVFLTERNRSPEAKARTTERNKAREWTPESRAKLSESAKRHAAKGLNRGRACPPERRSRISASLKGRLLSAATLAKRAETNRAKSQARHESKRQSTFPFMN